MEPVPGYRFANWELGYGDFQWCRTSPRCDRSAGRIARRWCIAMTTHVPVAPRNILARQVERARAMKL